MRMSPPDVACHHLAVRFSHLRCVLVIEEFENWHYECTYRDIPWRLPKLYRILYNIVLMRIPAVVGFMSKNQCLQRNGDRQSDVLM